MPDGRVLQLWRWPVKSMAGEQLRSLRADPRGVGGDRTHAVVHLHKGEWKPLTAREAPRLLTWRATYPFAPDAGLRPEDPPHAQVTAPDGRSWSWGDPRLRTALAADLGREVELRRDLAGIQDLERTVLVTVAASLEALGDELDGPIDIRRFRPNLHLHLDADPWAELGWEGRQLAFAGGVRVRLVHPCERCAIPTRNPDTQEKWPRLLRHLTARHGMCFGINGRVLAAGRIEIGEPVELLPATGPRATGR